EEVFNALGDKVMINVEIKEPTHPSISIVDKVIDLIHKRNLASSVVISSFNHDVLKQVYSKDKTLKIAVLTDKSLENIDPVKLTRSLHGISFNPDSQFITKEAVDKLHEAGLLVLPWSHTPDDNSETIQKMLNIGVDGIFTNHPDVMKEKIKKQGEE
ncbi:MAG: glycerophosphodiester phosphodiesterase, partial [Vampirovibrionia bacterium]